MERYKVSQLGNLTRLAAGGQGTVYDADGVIMPNGLELVYKEYNSKALRTLSVQVLEAMPEYLESLSMAEGNKILAVAAWPHRLVEDDSGNIIGFLMPKIPQQFKLQMRVSSGLKRVDGEFQLLLSPDDYLARREIAITDKVRFELLSEVAEALSVLHQHGLVVGDLSPKNMLFSLAPDRKIFFIDCDAMRFQGKSVANQLETPDWEIPKNEELATMWSDIYKLGLLVLRVLAGKLNTRNVKDLPSSVPSKVRDLLEQTIQATDPTARPAVTEWREALTTAGKSASTDPPVRNRSRPSPPPPKPFQPRPAPQPPAPIRQGPSLPPIVSPPQGKQQPNVPQPRQGWWKRRSVGQKVFMILLIVGVGVGIAVANVARNNGNDEPNWGLFSGSIMPADDPITSRDSLPSPFDVSPTATLEENFKPMIVDYPLVSSSIQSHLPAESRFSTDYWADIAAVELTSEVTLNVSFEANGYSDLLHPSVSCLIHRDTGSISWPIGEQLAVSEPGYYRGQLTFPILFDGTWNFQYACDQYNPAPLVTATNAFVGTSIQSAEKYASVIAIDFGNETLTMDVAVHGYDSGDDVGNSCLGFQMPLGYTTLVDMGHFQVFALEFARQDISEAPFIFSCSQYSAVGIPILPITLPPDFVIPNVQNNAGSPSSNSSPNIALEARSATVLANVVRVRSEPNVVAPRVTTLIGREDTTIDIFGQNVKGWYAVEEEGEIGWIFGAFVAPPDDGFWVVRSNDRRPLTLLDGFGKPLGAANVSGSFGLATNTVGTLWELILPTGNVAYVDKEDVHIVD